MDQPRITSTPAIRWHELSRLLREELRPYPGRIAKVARMLLAATIVLLLAMSLRLQFAFLGVFNAFLISRQSPRWLLANGPLVLLANVAGLLYVLAGLSLFSSYPVAYLAFLVLSFYLAFFVKAVLPSNYIAFGFSVLVAVLATFVWHQPGTADLRLEGMISLDIALILGTLTAMAIAWVVLWIGIDEAADAVELRLASLVEAKALSNPQYRRLALRGCLAGSLCIGLDSAAAWPVMMAGCAMICCATGAPGALQGSANWRAGLRALGLFIGGVVLGMGSQALLLPLIDSIEGFTIQFVLFSALAAWVATASPRLAYAGPTMAMGYMFTMLERFGPSESLARSSTVLTDMFVAVLILWLVVERERGISAAACVPNQGGSGPRS